MKFLKNFLINIAVLIGLGLIIYVIVPDLMRLVIEASVGLSEAIFGPHFGPHSGLLVIILAFIVAALPKARRNY
jgi:hypothetical protein